MIQAGAADSYIEYAAEEAYRIQNENNKMMGKIENWSVAILVVLSIIVACWLS
jgi:hypothetical protein